MLAIEKYRRAVPEGAGTLIKTKGEYHGKSSFRLGGGTQGPPG